MPPIVTLGVLGIGQQLSLGRLPGGLVNQGRNRNQNLFLARLPIAVAAFVHWGGQHAKHRSGLPLDRSPGGGNPLLSQPPGNGPGAEELFGEHRIVIAISPNFAIDGILFAGTSQALLRSMDSGDSWQHISNGLPQGWVTEIAISPDFRTDGIMFAATEKHGVLRSIDRGNSWQSVNNGLHLDEMAGQQGRVTGLAISPLFSTDGTLFASVFFQENRSGGTFRSTDAGSTWQAVHTGIAMWDVTPSPNFATDHTIFTGSDQGVFKSDDDGDSWHLVSRGSLHHIVWDVALSPRFPRDGVMLAATYGGLFRSSFAPTQGDADG